MPEGLPAEQVCPTSWQRVIHGCRWERKNLKIFIIEHEVEMRDELIRLLQKYGYQRSNASTQIHAFLSAARTKPSFSATLCDSRR